MEKIDFFFHYKHVCRFLLTQKLDISLNVFTIPKVTKALLFFVVKNLVDLEDIQLSNYFYLLKFFLGKKAYFSKFKSTFSLNVLYHSFLVQLSLKGKHLYFSIFFVTNEVFPFLGKTLLAVKNLKFYAQFSVLDMNIFVEKKTNVGFFNLKEPLNFRFYYSGINNDSTNFILLNLLKL
jgi:hypothetical protein